MILSTWHLGYILQFCILLILFSETNITNNAEKTAENIEGPLVQDKTPDMLNGPPVPNKTPFHGVYLTPFEPSKFDKIKFPARFINNFTGNSFLFVEYQFSLKSSSQEIQCTTKIICNEKS